MIQRRHLKSLELVIDSDVLHPRVKADLILIHTELKEDIKKRSINKHFKEDTEEN